jgi:hypothetical protein
MGDAAAFGVDRYCTRVDCDGFDSLFHALYVQQSQKGIEVLFTLLAEDASVPFEAACVP